METWVSGRATNLRKCKMTAKQIKDPYEDRGHEFKVPSIFRLGGFLPQFSCAQVQMRRMERNEFSTNWSFESQSKRAQELKVYTNMFCSATNVSSKEGSET